ncbi:MAG: 4-hydroxy-tetrahydrodipicolinate reductase [Lachnospiraceae bacterium]|nr:4-hydroxy-tetrahydrodipicolinate reductase [Lachnospiraceae bacterium]
MVRIIMHGCNGKMGKIITSLAAQDPDTQIVAGVDAFSQASDSYPVYAALADVKEQADVVIDFSAAVAVDGVLDYCEAKHLPLVLCTTGLSEEQIARAHAVSSKTAVLKAANMSLGINVLQKALTQIAPVLAEAGFDIEIVEKHHNQKKDAPSGTALALADTINEAMDGAYSYTYDRSQKLEPRGKKEIGISAVRGGTIPGDHDVIFAGEDEVITLSHRSYSRAVFGKGALTAAKYLAGKDSGFYDMSDVIG